jgi:hypothetical protein
MFTEYHALVYFIATDEKEQLKRRDERRERIIEQRKI